MPRYTDIDKLISEYDRVHVGPAGGARKLMVEAPIADVVPREEVEQLKEELEIWKQNRFNIFQRLECYEMTRQKVAREIFEEIDAIREKTTIGNIMRISFFKQLAELKKKYKEENNNDSRTN